MGCYSIIWKNIAFESKSVNFVKVKSSRHWGNDINVTFSFAESFLWGWNVVPETSLKI